MGCNFRLKAIRKAHPILEPKSGTQFPYAEVLQTKRPRLAMELGPKAQCMQLVLSADGPSAMGVRVLPYPR